MPPSDELRARILDDHNERLRDLEGHYTEVATRLAAQSVQIDQLGEAVDTGMKTLGQKIDEFAKPLTAQVQTIVERVDEHSTQLADLQKSESARKSTDRSRKKVLHKILLAVALAAATAVGTHVAETVWNRAAPPPPAQVQSGSHP